MCLLTRFVSVVEEDDHKLKGVHPPMEGPGGAVSSLDQEMMGLFAVAHLEEQSLILASLLVIYH